MSLAKIAFSHCADYKVYCACAVSRDLYIGGHPKPHVTIFDPELSIHYTTFMGLGRRLRVVLYWSISVLKQFLAAKKLFSQNRSPKWRFFENLSVQILMAPQRQIIGHKDVFDVF